MQSVFFSGNLGVSFGRGSDADADSDSASIEDKAKSCFRFLFSARFCRSVGSFSVYGARRLLQPPNLAACFPEQVVLTELE